jgi:predicted anti-sigma-YlaC factor YlaD
MKDVDCQTCREALSARIDGEAEPEPADLTDAHLATCAACRTWQARATAMARTLRVREASPVPDLSDEILATAPSPVNARGWWPRLGLGVVAVAQITLALGQILEPATGHGGHGSTPFAGHLFNESTAWNLALGIGLFWAAFRPRATSGMVPVLGGFVLVLLVYSTIDLVNGAAPVARVAGHGLLVAALCLLVVVNRRSTTPPHGNQTRIPEPEADHAYPADEPATDRRQPPGRPPLRPASHHRAA